MRLLSCREEFARDIAELQMYIYYKLLFPCTVGEFHRTPAQQAMYYEGWQYIKGLFVLSGEKRSKVRISQHQKRLAADINIWDNRPMYEDKLAPNHVYFEVGKYWCNLNPKNRWGGNFGVKKKNWFTQMGWDRCHFERRS